MTPGQSSAPTTLNPNTVKYPWTVHYDDEGQEYYHNSQTGESTWDPPEEGLEPLVPKNEEDKEDEDKEQHVEIPQKVMEENDGDNGATSHDSITITTQQQLGWSKHIDDNGMEYYYNSVTQETTWEKPSNFLEEVENDEHEAIVNSNQNDVSADSVGKSRAIQCKVEEEEEERNVEEDENALEQHKWQRHEDDQGRKYYYDEVSGETTWDKPSSYESSGNDDDDDDDDDEDNNSDSSHDDDEEQDRESNSDQSHSFPKTFTSHDLDDDNDDDDRLTLFSHSQQFRSHDNDDNENQDSPQASSPPNDTTLIHPDKATPDQDNDIKTEHKSGTIVKLDDGAWSKHMDEEGREYYYNETTQQTQWEKPIGFVDSAPSKWSKHLDEEGREYYYNEASGETTWNMPPEFQQDSNENDHQQQQHQPERNVPNELVSDKDKTVRTKHMDTTITQMEDAIDKSSPEPETVIDPAVKRLQDAEAALNQPDAIMEPNCLDNVRELISGGGNEGGAKAMQSLISSFRGETAICGILGLWMANLKKADEPEKFNDKAMDQVRETVQQVIDKVAKDRFTKAGGDNIFQLKKSEAVFLEDMMDSSLWRKLLIDLSATHRDSTLLNYCLSSISKRGHHREISKRINQSDHFPVYSAMLTSEFAIVGNCGEVVNIHELVDDLRRSCTSTSYTYLYAVELLRHLVQMAEEQATRDSSIKHAIRKWSRLREELENAMVDPAVSAKTAGASTLYRKRRRDVALIISELTQRQRRRLRPGIDANGHLRDENRDALELALSNLLLRHAEGKKFDDSLLDELLEHDNNLKELGQVMISHPLAIKALLGHLFLPGTLRVGSLNTRSKCARLIAFAVLEAECATRSEPSDNKNDDDHRQAREEEIKGNLLVGSQMCELVENMVSFVVSSDTTTKEANPSAGIKLSILANKSAPVAQGVTMWAKELVSSNEFVISASYPTLAPSMLSLVRVISTRHPFTRPTVLSVAVTFLGHSNSEMTFQKMNEIKEQALRVMFSLLVQGEITSVLGTVLSLLESNNTTLDSSLTRYFVGGLLDMVQPPCSRVMVGAMGKLLMCPSCIEPLKSPYFPDERKLRLKTLIAMLQHGCKEEEGENMELLDNLRKTYT